MDEGVWELNDEVILPGFYEVHCELFVNCQTPKDRGGRCVTYSLKPTLLPAGV